MSRLALVVGNPSAQSGQAARSIVRATELLAAHGLATRVVHTEPEGRTPAIVAHAIEAHTPDLVCTLGGDGTFNEVARGILASRRDVPMGLFPMGTANDQGKSFGIAAGPAHLEEQAAIVATGFTRRIDAGHIRALEGERELAIDATSRACPCSRCSTATRRSTSAPPSSACSPRSSSR
jgi:diacylglycerol kinase family enzyme